LPLDFARNLPQSFLLIFINMLRDKLPALRPQIRKRGGKHGDQSASQVPGLLATRRPLTNRQDSTVVRPDSLPMKAPIRDRLTRNGRDAAFAELGAGESSRSRQAPYNLGARTRAKNRKKIKGNKRKFPCISFF
jgi:hypothetical protein